MGCDHMIGKGSDCHYLMSQPMPNKRCRIARTVSSGNFPKASLLKSSASEASSNVQLFFVPQATNANSAFISRLLKSFLRDVARDKGQEQR